jgi:hypothetical protein
MICNELPNPSLELDCADYANPEAEVVQRAAQIVLGIACLGLQTLAAR